MSTYGAYTADSLSLIDAAKNNDVASIDRLLNMIHSISSKALGEAFAEAAKCGSIDALQTIWATHANLLSRADLGWALGFAIEFRQLSTVEYLLQHHADDIPHHHKALSLRHCAGFGYDEIASLLVKYFENKISDEEIKASYDIAISKDHQVIVDLLRPKNTLTSTGRLKP